MADDRYDEALKIQRLQKGIDRLLKEFPASKPFGPVDETCPHCGGPIETLFNKEGRHPLRGCWRCALAGDTDQ